MIIQVLYDNLRDKSKFSLSNFHPLFGARFRDFNTETRYFLSSYRGTVDVVACISQKHRREVSKA